MAELSAQGAVIKAAYEGEADTNAFTDERREKLDSIATRANRVATGTVTAFDGDLDFSGGLGGGGFTTEEVQDIVGAMISGDAVDGLTVTYDDAGNAIGITLVDGVMARKSPWDPTSGAFPAGAQNGYFYRVTGAGTVDSVDFFDGDFLVATVDDASTATMAANWELIKASPDRYATAAQGTKADSAVQPADLDPTFTALSASRDTTSADDGADIESDAGTAITLTVVAGTVTRGLTVRQMGAGAVTIEAGAGVTIHKEADVQAVTNAQYGIAFLAPTSTVDTFILTGSLAAV